jgi:hypothetical protein
MLIMSDRDYTALRLQEVTALCHNYFRVNIDVKELVFDDIETAPEASCLLFKSSNGLYALFNGTADQTLADVKYRAKQIGLKVDGYAYPNGDNKFFFRHARRAFQKAYPGRNNWTAQEARYYMTTAPYSPGLVKVSSVEGELRRYIAQDKKWRKVYDYTYQGSKS